MPIWRTAVNYETTSPTSSARTAARPAGGAALLAWARRLWSLRRAGWASAMAAAISIAVMNAGRAQANYAEPACQSFLAREVDRIAAEAFLDAVRPAGLETTIAALQGFEPKSGARSIGNGSLRLERARYEARMAQRAV